LKDEFSIAEKRMDDPVELQCLVAEWFLQLGFKKEYSPNNENRSLMRIKYNLSVRKNAVR
jgi:hypothetical protein